MNRLKVQYWPNKDKEGDYKEVEYFYDGGIKFSVSQLMDKAKLILREGLNKK
jgi:hypothetical protein